MLHKNVQNIKHLRTNVSPKKKLFSQSSKCYVSTEIKSQVCGKYDSSLPQRHTVSGCVMITQATDDKLLEQEDDQCV